MGTTATFFRQEDPLDRIATGTPLHLEFVHRPAGAEQNLLYEMVGAYLGRKEDTCLMDDGSGELRRIPRTAIQGWKVIRIDDLSKIAHELQEVLEEALAEEKGSEAVSLVRIVNQFRGLIEYNKLLHIHHRLLS